MGVERDLLQGTIGGGIFNKIQKKTMTLDFFGPILIDFKQAQAAVKCVSH